MLHNLDELKFFEHKSLKYLVAYYKNHPYLKGTPLAYMHRLIMENYLNRYLNSKEHVHHKDGNRLNNDISNLELLSSSEHAKEHVSENLLGKQGLKLLDNKICSTCKKEFDPKKFKQKYCSVECNLSSKQKIEWPSIKELELQLETKTMVQLAKELGVSGSAIKKHIQKYK